MQREGLKGREQAAKEMCRERLRGTGYNIRLHSYLACAPFCVKPNTTRRTCLSKIVKVPGLSAYSPQCGRRLEAPSSSCSTAPMPSLCSLISSVSSSSRKKAYLSSFRAACMLILFKKDTTSCKIVGRDTIAWLIAGDKNPVSAGDLTSANSCAIICIVCRMVRSSGREHFP